MRCLWVWMVVAKQITSNCANIHVISYINERVHIKQPFRTLSFIHWTYDNMITLSANTGTCGIIIIILRTGIVIIHVGPSS